MSDHSNHPARSSRHRRYKPYAFYPSVSASPSPSASSLASSSSSQIQIHPRLHTHSYPNMDMFQTPGHELFTQHTTSKAVAPDQKLPPLPRGAIVLPPGQPWNALRARDRVPMPQLALKSNRPAAAKMAPIVFNWAGTPLGWGVRMDEFSQKGGHFIAEHMIGGYDIIATKYKLRTINLRIVWPGYEESIDQGRVIDLMTPAGPMTRAQLASIVVDAMSRYCQKALQFRCDPKCAPWRIGRDAIRLDHFVLVALLNISGDTWQADIILERQYTMK
ncbi:hypothetical protein FA95DRAFT_1600888 [Auriscalpium vulgare]|uniref:Uncharacterized protein n=1 Tax=Auriscalpium vulgare TaxID=40419 RepID=A0ACB8SC22_9AGAM|nr:hypothetical protein FA95DRAFT_1600888 [Auriscalpium vulgare]